MTEFRCPSDDELEAKIQDRDESVWADDPTGEMQEKFSN